MTEPRRLLDDATGIERDVLMSAELDDPPVHRRRRVAAAAIAAAASLSTTTTAVAAGGKTIAAFATWKIVVGIAVVTAAVSLSVAKSRPAKPSAPPPIASAPIAIAPHAQKIVVPDPPKAPPASASVVEIAKPPAPSIAEPPIETGPALAKETALLDAARAAIAAGDGVKALAALDRYQIECKGGAMVVESEVLRIEAVAATGDKNRASALARRFLEAHPGSAYETRINKHVIDDAYP